jgi:mRNA-degrading endonuclease RelE of RelBE toxin-antitoxin system
VTGWTVELSKSAEKEFRPLPDGPQAEAAALVADLAEDPGLVPAVELRANPPIWRARFHQDRYRMIYQITKKTQRVLIKRIRLRPTAYEGMKH